MIRRILEALEAGKGRALLQGLDARGAIAWERTGEDLLARSGAWQELLRGRGVEPGDRVAVDVARGPELLPAHVAVIAWGAAVVPLNPTLARAERARLLERADPRTILADCDVPARGGAVALRDPPGGSPSLLLFTSGTTGEPKGVPLELRNLEANLAALEEAWGLGPTDRLLHVLPAHHLHGLALALYGSARLGIPVVLDERFEADRALRALRDHEVTVFMGVPTMYHRMVRSPVEVELRSMRLFVSGSAPLRASDFRDFETRFGHAPLERYGLTETMIVTTNPLRGERRAGTVGLALPGTEVRLAPDGEIEVRSPAVMKAYWREPQSSPAATDGFFATGDLGQRDDRGYLVVVGRKKELILVGGSNVVPGEVERALGAEPGVEEIAAIGLPDADLGEIVAAFVVAREGEEERGLERRLRARAERDLAPYKRPRLYRCVDALPRNAMGKVDRRALASTASG